MHVVVSFTDQGDNANTRIKFYINGAFVDHNTGTVLVVSETGFYNHKDYIHYIGSRAQQSYGTNTFDAQYFDVFLVDGQALTADVFGFYKEGKDISLLVLQIQLISVLDSGLHIHQERLRLKLKEKVDLASMVSIYL